MTNISSLISFGREGRADYACQPHLTRGRKFDADESPTRTAFQRDRDRIIHATAFRRLKHKTQVFVFHEGDHYRTRLTHTLEVAQIARSLARALRLDEDLAEAIALAHDLGHTPFGHAGERVLNRLMVDDGGFNHNAQALRVVAELENRYAQHDGLNLSWETLEGIIKHNGPLTDQSGQPLAPYAETGLPFYMDVDVAVDGLMLWTHASLEAQAAAVADDIAYNAHDIDDGLRAGLLDMADIAKAPIVGQCLADVTEKYGELDEARTIHELIRRLITTLVENVIKQSTHLINDVKPTSVYDVRHAKRALVTFDPEMASAQEALHNYLSLNLYQHPDVTEVMKKAEIMTEKLFKHYDQDINEMPYEWAQKAQNVDAQSQSRIVCDFIAGMTDRFALNEYRRLFDQDATL